MPVALIAGSTGLVGGHLLRILVEGNFFERVVAVGRRPPEIRHEKMEFVPVRCGNTGLLRRKQ